MHLCLYPYPFWGVFGWAVNTRYTPQIPSLPHPPFMSNEVMSVEPSSFQSSSRMVDSQYWPWSPCLPLEAQNKSPNPPCPYDSLAQIGATCQQRFHATDDPGLGIFSSSCWERVRICLEQYRASSVEGWQWDIDTDAQGWRFTVTRSATARTKPNAQAHVGCSFSSETSGKRRRQKNKISILRASAHVSAYCLALAFVCLSAQTPNTERDRLPPDSYLLVLVSLCSV